MWMNEEDIVRMYKESKHKKHQVDILAELNQCDRGQIMKVLIANGVRPGRHKRMQGENRSKAIKVPLTMYQSFLEKKDMLEKKLEEVDEKLKEHEDLISRVSQLAAEKMMIIDEIEEVNELLNTLEIDGGGEDD